MKRNLIFLIHLAAAACLFTGCAHPGREPDNDRLIACSLGSTANTHRIGDILFAGQPAREDIPVFAGAGIRTVINLRHERELQDWDEPSMVAGAGMEFVRIPFGGGEELTDAVFDSVREQLRSARRPVLLHCASANRVGAVWIPYRVLDEGVPLEQALAEAEQIGLRGEVLRQRAQEYVKKFRD